MKLIRKTILRSGPLCREKKNLEKQSKFINIAMILPLLHLTKDPLIFAVRALVSTTTPACSPAFTLISVSQKTDVCVLCLHSCPTLCEPPGLQPTRLLCPGSSVFSRQEYWSGLPRPPPGDLWDPGIKPISSVSCIGRRFLYHCSTCCCYCC